LTVESNDTQYILRLDGDCTMLSAAELKAALVEGLAAAKDLNKDLRVDLSAAGEIDITGLQLLWAAQRAAELDHRRFVSQAREEILAFTRNAGFEGLPGQAVEG
jgi:ABC-type transporter Mla MlaB component